MSRKIRLSWRLHLSVAHKHTPDYLPDLRDKAFDWDGDSFYLTEKDFADIQLKHMDGTPEEVGKEVSEAFGRFGESVEIPSIVVGPRGLGDSIASLTSKVGIRPCGGCKERQKWLNELVPYNKA
jgi:hypothetical protein